MIEDEKIERFGELSSMLVDFLRENYNPHTTIVITHDCAKIVSDEIGIPFKPNIYVKNN